MRRFLLALTLVSLLLTACSGSQPAAQKAKIKFAVLPILDVFPLHVAKAQGYFEKNGLEVELIPVQAAAERDQLMQSGQIDGMLTEVVTTLFYNKVEPKVKIVRFARTASSEYPLFRILAAKDAGIIQPADLKGVPVGISEGTVIEYTTDRILEKAGLAKEDIQKIAVPKIPDRLALLGSGQLKAANLPDPMASLAVLQGANVVVDDTIVPELSNSELAFSTKFITENPEAVKAFLKAVEQAVVDINADKTKWNKLLLDLKLVPEPVLKNYMLPTFPVAGVPSQSQFDDAQGWALEKGLIPARQDYNNSVDASFLPK